MIWLYSGTPGSGKSFHVAKQMMIKLRQRKNVISTVDINLMKVSKKGRVKIGQFEYIPILELTPKCLYDFAFKYHKKGKEGQTLLVIDECQIIYNSRDYQKSKDRMEWILFFTRHRHLGFNIIMITQFDRMIDRQIRALFEYEVKHRKVNNAGLLMFLPFTVFAQISYWYGNKLVVGKDFTLYKKSIASIYDSYVMYDEYKKEMCVETEESEAKEETEPAPMGGETGVRGSPLNRASRRVTAWFTDSIHNAAIKAYAR